MELKTLFAQDTAGNIIPMPTVHLYQLDGTTPVTGLKDAAGDALSNPFIGTTGGRIQLAAPDGDFVLRVVGAGRDYTQRIRFIDVTTTKTETAAAAAAAQQARAGAETARNEAAASAQSGSISAAVATAAAAAAQEAADGAGAIAGLSPAVVALLLDPKVTLPVKSATVELEPDQEAGDIPTALTAPLTVDRYSGSTDVTFTASGSSIRATVAGGLATGISRAAVVRALQGDGAGMLIAVRMAGIAGAPTTPDAPAVTLTPGFAQISVDWVDGADNGSAITAHRIYVNGAVRATYSGAPPYVVTDLPSNADVFVQVAAISALGEGTKSTLQSAKTPPVTVYRTANTYTSGSSTYLSAQAENPLNMRGNAVPAEFIGTTWQNRANALVPTQNASQVMALPANQFATPEEGSVYSTAIRLAIQDAITKGNITPASKVVWGSHNANEALNHTPQNIWTYDQLIMGDLNAAGVQRWQLGGVFPKPGYFLHSRYAQLWGKRQQWALDNPHPYKGVFWFHEGHIRGREDAAIEAALLPDDVYQINRGECPTTFRAPDTSHDVGTGYRALGNYYAKVERAFEGGVPFVPTIDYFVRKTAPGFLTDLLYVGDLTGVTATVDDANYTAAVVNNPAYPTDPRPKLLKLSCTELPTKAGLNLWVTLTKSGYVETERFRIILSVSRRVAGDTAPKKTRLRNQVVMTREIPYGVSGGDGTKSAFFPANTRKFSLVWIGRFEQDDGNNLEGVAAGSNDSRNQFLWQYVLNSRTLAQFRHSVSSHLLLTILDDVNGGNTNAINVSTSVSGADSQPFSIDKGFRAFFISYDADNPASCSFYVSNCIRRSNGAAVPGYGAAFTPGGTGTLGLARLSTSSADGFTLFRNGTSNQASTYAEITHWLTWMATDFVDFSVQANRDLFWDRATCSAKDIGATGTVLGVTPHLYLPCDAAELYMGGRDIPHTDILEGGVMCRNWGSGPGLIVHKVGDIEIG